MYIIDENNANDISEKLLDETGRLRLLSYKDYLNYSFQEFRLFCHHAARYGIPTLELLDFLKSIIGDRSVIEIGSGAGDLGYHLNIRMTDNKFQESADIIEIYKNMHQPTIRYPKDVEKIEALEAVKKYKPQVVIASWVTTYSDKVQKYGSCPHGVKEKEILNLVETYILIGNVDIHGDKPIMKRPHKVINEPFILSRGQNQKGNRIWIWDKGGKNGH